jgi:hypothetical protein
MFSFVFDFVQDIMITKKFMLGGSVFFKYVAVVAFGAAQTASDAQRDKDRRWRRRVDRPMSARTRCLRRPPFLLF